MWVPQNILVYSHVTQLNASSGRGNTFEDWLKLYLRRLWLKLRTWIDDKFSIRFQMTGVQDPSNYTVSRRTNLNITSSYSCMLSMQMFRNCDKESRNNSQRYLERHHLKWTIYLVNELKNVRRVWLSEGLRWLIWIEASLCLSWNNRWLKFSPQRSFISMVKIVPFAANLNHSEARLFRIVEWIISEIVLTCNIMPVSFTKLESMEEW